MLFDHATKFAKLSVALVALLLCSCSSIMTHSGHNGTYSGVKASSEMLSNQEIEWSIKPFILLDMPLTAVADTLFLPWDLFHQQETVHSRLMETTAEDPVKMD